MLLYWKIFKQLLSYTALPNLINFIEIILGYPLAKLLKWFLLVTEVHVGHGVRKKLQNAILKTLLFENHKLKRPERSYLVYNII